MVGKTFLLVALFGIALAAADICKHDGDFCLSHENCCSYSCQLNKCEDVPNPKEEDESLENISSLESDVAAYDELEMESDEYSVECRRTGASCSANNQCCSNRCLAIVNRCAFRSGF